LAICPASDAIGVTKPGWPLGVAVVWSPPVSYVSEPCGMTRLDWYQIGLRFASIADPPGGTQTVAAVVADGVGTVGSADAKTPVVPVFVTCTKSYLSANWSVPAADRLADVTPDATEVAMGRSY
jgi:hypothetical protein